MPNFDASGFDANSIARANAHFTFALASLLVEKGVLTTSDLPSLVVSLSDRLEKATGVGEQGAARVLRQTFGLHPR